MSTNGASTARRLKMKDLERATGVSRETIRYYIREGMLPQPERPGRNVAWYDEAYVERLGLIKELQQKRFLPLQVIKTILGGESTPSRDEVHSLMELDGKVFPAVARMPAGAPERLTRVARRMKLSAAEIRVLADVEAITVTTRDGSEWLDETAVRIVELWGKFRAAGFSQALGFSGTKLRVYVDFVRWLAREELRIFARGITGKVPPEQAARMAEAGITILNQILAQMRKATLMTYLAEGNLPPARAQPMRRNGRAAASEIRRGKRYS